MEGLFAGPAISAFAISLLCALPTVLLYRIPTRSWKEY